MEQSQNNSSMNSTTDVDPRMQQWSAPKRRRTSIETAFYFISGLSVAIGSYSQLSIGYYLIDRYTSLAFVFIIFGTNLGGFAAFFVYKRVFPNPNEKTVALVGPTLLFCLISLLILVGKLVEDPENSVKRFVFVPLYSFATGALIFIIRYTYSSIIFRRGPVEVAYFNAGMPIAGILTSGISFLLLKYMDGADPFHRALCYGGFQLACLAWIIAITLQFFKAEEKNKAVHKIPLNPVPETNGSPPPSLIRTLKLIYPMMYSNFFSWSISTMIMPNMLWAMGIGGENKKIDEQLILIFYLLFDLPGRLIYTKFAVKSTLVIHYLGLLRVLLIAIPLFAYGSPSNSWFLDRLEITLPYCALGGLITGYISSSQMHITSARVVMRHKDNAAYLMTLSTLFGQVFGSLCNVVALNLQL